MTDNFEHGLKVWFLNLMELYTLPPDSMKGWMHVEPESLILVNLEPGPRYARTFIGKNGSHVGSVRTFMNFVAARHNVRVRLNLRTDDQPARNIPETNNPDWNRQLFEDWIMLTCGLLGVNHQEYTLEDKGDSGMSVYTLRILLFEIKESSRTIHKETIRRALDCIKTLAVPIGKCQGHLLELTYDL